MAIDPITAISIAQMGAGLASSIFGGGTKTAASPELRRVLAALEEESTAGLSQEERLNMAMKAERRLQNEFNAASQLNEARIAQQGAGVQNAARLDLQGKLFSAKGDVTIGLEALNLDAKRSARETLARLLPSLQQQGGQGGAALFGSGIETLLQGQRDKNFNQALAAVR